ncbi:MGMT family protein [Pantoea sp. 1.19]|uniref:MGMT family protein n=1 Tax=Pantoea sp. 1.19 TaxID=1925589 RepID=UPI000948F578|nr:MGMT family protein [Pantoea sp. 1.19]
MDEELQFPQRVWQVIAAIPAGRVATYGDIARLAGSPRAARQVGGVLRRLPEGSTLPWHRVINHNGALSLQGERRQRQREALRREGIDVNEAGRLALARYRWCP